MYAVAIPSPNCWSMGDTRNQGTLLLCLHQLGHHGNPLLWSLVQAFPHVLGCTLDHAMHSCNKSSYHQCRLQHQLGHYDPGCRSPYVHQDTIASPEEDRHRWNLLTRNLCHHLRNSEQGVQLQPTIRSRV